MGRAKGHCPQVHRVVETDGDGRRIDRLNVESSAIETRSEHPAVREEAVGIGGVEFGSGAITRKAQAWVGAWGWSARCRGLATGDNRGPATGQGRRSRKTGKAPPDLHNVKT